MTQLTRWDYPELSEGMLRSCNEWMLGFSPPSRRIIRALDCSLWDGPDVEVTEESSTESKPKGQLTLGFDF